MNFLRKLIGFTALGVVLLFVSCGPYRISTETLRQELQLVNDSLPTDRLINIPAQYINVNNVHPDKRVEDVRITVDRKGELYMVLKKNEDTLIHAPKNTSVSYSYNEKKYFFPDNAWVQNDTLHYTRYCSDTNFKTIALSEIDYIEVDYQKVRRKGKICRGIGFEPSFAQQIDGLSISFATMPNFFYNTDTVNINGVNLGIEIQWVGGAVAGVLVTGMAIPYLIAAPFQPAEKSKQKPQIQYTIELVDKKSVSDSLIAIDTTIRKTFPNDNYCDKYRPPVNIIGLNIGILGSSWQNNNIHGANICGLGTISNQIKGFSLTGGVSVIEEQNGVVISGLVNVVKKGSGLQISIVNYAKQFKGIQFGLWNRNEKRSLPIVNWNFK